MGIDPGLTRCGLSVVDSGSGKSIAPIAVGVARTDPDAPLEQRVLELYRATTEWIEEYSPEVVAIERLFQRGNVSTVMNTAHGSGVLHLAAAEHGLDVYGYTPSEVKKAITGSGTADKKQMTYMVTHILGLSEMPKPADAADALALAICHSWQDTLNTKLKGQL